MLAINRRAPQLQNSRPQRLVRIFAGSSVTLALPICLVSRMPASQKSRHIEARSGTRLGFATFLVLVYLVPPLLILFRVVPFAFRFHLLLISALIVLAYVILMGDSASKLGFRADTLKRSTEYNLGVTLLALMAIAALHFLGLIRAPTIPQWRWFFVFYVLLSCPAQEFLFRSALFAEMDRSGVVSRFWQISISSLAYCFLHVIYRDSITLGVTFLMGVIWGVGYYSWRNFWGVTISHCILGTFSILVGLI
jgi:CAAX protease family protein